MLHKVRSTRFHGPVARTNQTHPSLGQSHTTPYCALAVLGSFAPHANFSILMIGYTLLPVLDLSDSPSC